MSDERTGSVDRAVMVALGDLRAEVRALRLAVDRGAVAAMRFRDAARYLGVSETTIRRMVADGRLRTVPNVDGCRLIARVELERFANAAQG